MLKWVLILCLTFSNVNAQEYAPFETFKPFKKAEYLRKKNQLKRLSKNKEQNQELIKLAYAYKDHEGLILALEKEIETQPQAAELYYRLAGVQGIRSLEVSRIFAPPYLRGMIKNFEKALQLAPNHIPALEAYIEVLCKIPSLFGGSESKAKNWAQRLEELSPMDGALAHALILRETEGFNAAVPKYQAIFNQLSTSDFCENPQTFFKGKSINYPYKLAEMVVLTSSSSEVGLCAIEYFIDKASSYYNIPMEWAYYRKGQLLLKQGEEQKAREMFKKALEINPKFERAKKELF